MWKRGWIERGIGQTEWLNGLAEGEAKRRKSKTIGNCKKSYKAWNKY